VNKNGYFCNFFRARTSSGGFNVDNGVFQLLFS
jgi:hypothetical protein